MDQAEQYALLCSNVSAWNEWRTSNPNITPELVGATVLQCRSNRC